MFLTPKDLVRWRLTCEPHTRWPVATAAQRSPVRLKRGTIEEADDRDWLAGDILVGYASVSRLMSDVVLVRLAWAFLPNQCIPVAARERPCNSCTPSPAECAPKRSPEMLHKPGIDTSLTRVGSRGRQKSLCVHRRCVMWRSSCKNAIGP